MSNVGVESSNRIGFMQGRLSPIPKGRIQSFPWETWQEEFETASRVSQKKSNGLSIQKISLLTPCLLWMDGRKSIDSNHFMVSKSLQLLATTSWKIHLGSLTQIEY